MKPVALLHVEDDSDDAFLFERALRRSNLACAIQRAVDGQQAIDYLSGSDGFSDRLRFPLPDVVVLDLKLPVCDGFEVLQWIRGQEQFRSLPVVVVSGSGLEQDQSRAAEAGATRYFVKSGLYSDVAEYLAAIRDGSQ